VLAKANRLVRANDYRNAVRRGSRFSAMNAVVYIAMRDDALPVRFGFIVAKTVGGAVVRNRVRRRLKAIGYELTARIEPGTDVVIRALPASAQASWTILQNEILGLLARNGARR
jgi:ribonuclease P protein component